MTPINFTGVFINTDGVTIVIHLKNTVMLNDPGDFASHIGADNRCRKLGMVQWGKIVTEIMN